MSNYNRSLALEEMKESEVELGGYLPAKHLNLSNESTEAQLEHRVVKVCGTITVSF